MVDLSRAASLDQARLLDRQSERLEEIFERERRLGLQLAMRTRIAALLIIVFALILGQQGALLAINLGLAGVFILSAAIQDLVGRSRHDRPWHKYAFAAIDGVLLTMTLIVPHVAFGFLATPLELRGYGFLYFYVFLAFTVLSLSTRYVLAYGAILASTWAAGVFWIVWRTHPKTNINAVADTTVSPADRIFRSRYLDYLDPAFFDATGWLNQLVLFIIVTGILALGVERARRLVRRQASTERERGNLARYFSPNVVDELARLDEPLGPVRQQNVAVLFADIVGFSTYAERASPEHVINLLRSHFEWLGGKVFAHGGTIDKYIGDSLMATFGTPRAGADDATRALRCARDALGSLEGWNRERMGHGEDPLRFCVGLHYGPVVLGNIGNERRLEFTVIGDTVNVAARLEALTRRLGFDLVVSEDLVAAVQREGGETALAGLIQGEATPLRGRHGMVPIWMYHKASETPSQTIP